jgi:predicted transcriptional regulator
MSLYEAKEIVDLVIEELRERGVIPEDKYGKMPVHYVEEIAEKVIEKVEE